jgi:hypothetical protein
VLTRPLLTTQRPELLLLMLPVHRQLLRPLRLLPRSLPRALARLLRALAGLVLRLVRLVLGHDEYFAGRT